MWVGSTTSRFQTTTKLHTNLFGDKYCLQHKERGDDDTAVAQRPHGRNTNNHADDDEVEVVNVRSADTVRRERRKASDIVSLTNGSTSIRSTFSSISATVTALRSGTKLQERKVAIKAESVMITYEATRMQLTTDINGVDKFSLAPGEKPNERKIILPVVEHLLI